MRSLIIIATVLAFVCQEVMACCHSASVTTCCGNGKCNIFCCNCKHGCKTNCGIDSPVCWAFGAKVICTNSVKPRAAILANNLAALAGSKEQKAMLKVADNEDVPFCHDSPGGQVMCTKAVRPQVTLLGHDLAEKAGSETDEAMHKAADTEGVGHFTFEQFLAHTKSENSPETLVYFNKYDKNGDGVITLDEMRLDDEETE